MIRATEFASKCPVCGGREFSPLISVRPDAFTFPPAVKLAPAAKGNREVIVLARACMSCGYMLSFAALDELRAKLGVGKLSPQQVDRVLKNMEMIGDSEKLGEVSNHSPRVARKVTATLSAEALVNITQSQPSEPPDKALESLQKTPGSDPWSDELLDKSNDEALDTMKTETVDEPPEGFKPRP